MISKKYIYDIPDDESHAANKVIQWVSCDSDVLEIGCAGLIKSRILKEKMGCRVTGLKVDPIIALKKMLPFLKERGHIIASIPNIAHTAISWELAHGRFDYQQYCLLDNTHIRFFTKKNVAKLFEEAGYQIISWDRFIKAPDKTEFNIHCNSAMDQSFLEWVSELNPEANTYQFIVKACPILEKEEELKYEQLEKIEVFEKLVHQLEFESQELKMQNLKLKSQLYWLENHRFGFLTGIINKFL